MKKVILKKTIKKIHLWLGLSSGIIVFILGVTGCLYVFEEELRPMVHNYYTIDKVEGEPLPLSELFLITNDTLTSINQKPATFVKVSNKIENTILFRSIERDTAANSIWYWDEIKIMNTYVNPYNGKIVEIENLNKEFFRIVFMLHWSLMLKNDIGQPIVGIATIIFVIMLITGIVLWWPKNKAARKQRVRFRWKNTTKWKRKNYDLHNILGFYSMFLVLFIALTGLVWAFDWFNNSVQWVANGGKTIETKQVVYQSDSLKTAQLDPIDEVYEYLKTHHSKAENYFISLPQNNSATYTTFVNYFNGRTQDIQIYFGQYSGEPLSKATWKDKNNGEKIRSINYDIHIGSILGFPGKIIAFCLSLIAASLPITGFLIWWGRKKKKKKGK